MNHPIENLAFPVAQTGTYFNETTRKYEFWFFLNGKAAKCGECNHDLPNEVIRNWRSHTLAGLQGVVFKAIAEGRLHVMPFSKDDQKVISGAESLLKH